MRVHRDCYANNPPVYFYSIDLSEQEAIQIMQQGLGRDQQFMTELRVRLSKIIKTELVDKKYTGLGDMPNRSRNNEKKK